MEELTSTIKYKPKVPIRKQRKQVKKACINCRRSKTKCSDERPCKRCVNLGISHNCIDAPIKQKVIKYIVEQFPSKINKKSYSPNNLETIEVNGNKYNTGADTVVLDTNKNTENDYLSQEIEKLQREQEEMQCKIVSLKKSLQTQEIFSDLALTRWYIGEFGACQLLSFSNGFMNLIEKPAHDLYKYFCINLYPKCYHAKTQVLYRIVASCRIDSVTSHIVIQTGTGKHVDVFSTVHVDEDNPQYVTACMETFDPNASIYKDIPIFEPLVTKLKDSNHNSPCLIQKTNISNYTDSSISQPIQRNSPPLVQQTSFQQSIQKDSPISFPIQHTPSPLVQQTPSPQRIPTDSSISHPIKPNLFPISNTQNISPQNTNWDTNNITPDCTQQYQSLDTNIINSDALLSNNSRNSLNPSELLDELDNDDVFNFINKISE